jgi:hypothetical protein
MGHHLVWKNDDESLDFGSTPIFRHTNSSGFYPIGNKGITNNKWRHIMMEYVA